MSDQMSNSDPLFNKFKESFSEYKADFTPDELNSSWSSVQSGLTPVQPVNSGSFSKILSAKGIAITGSVAVLVTAAVVMYNVFSGSNKNEPVEEPPTTSENLVFNNDNNSVEDVNSSNQNPAKEIQNNNTTTKQKTEKTAITENEDQGNDPLVIPSQQPVSGQNISGLPGLQVDKTPVNQSADCHIQYFDTVLCTGDSFRFVFYASEDVKSLLLYFAGNRYLITPGYHAIAVQTPEIFMAIFEISSSGLTRTWRKQVVVNRKPFVDFAFDKSGSPTIRFIAKTDYSSSIEWDFGDLTKSFDQNTSHTYLIEGNFRVSLTAQSDAGCVDSVVKEILVTGKTDIRIPNSFSPNNDGVNDEFFITLPEVEYFNLVIIDRYNNILFETNSVEKHWKGTDQSTGYDCLAGTYYFVLKYKIQGDKNFITNQGKLRLFR